MGRKTKMNKITSPELLAQVNPENTDLLKEFLAYLKSTKKSQGTIDQYKSDIEIAFVWNLQHNKNLFFCDWTKRQIVKFQNWLIEDNGNSPSRVRRVKASLSSMSNFIEAILDDDFPNFRNIINKIESPPNVPTREKTIWTEEEVKDLLDKLTDKKKYDMACFLALAAYSGRRKSELCRFKVSDFSDDKLVCDGALYKSDPIQTKGRGGGKFINCYTLAKKFKPYLNMWLEDRIAKGIESEWLFPHLEDQSKQMPVSTANSWSKVFSRLSGKESYLHAFRHFFTSSLVQAGIPDGVIQAIVNWESADMVRLYDDTSTDEQISMYFKGGDIVAPQRKGLGDL